MRRTALPLALLLLTALRCAAAAIVLDVPADLRPAWERIMTSQPPPAGTIFLPSDRGSVGNGTLVVRIGAQPGARVVSRIALSPVTLLSDPRNGAASADVRAGRFRVVPFESVTLPERALPVDRLYPDSPGYGVWGDVTISLDTADPGLKRWYESLPAPSTPGPADIVWIGAVGDVMPARGVDAELLSDGGVRRVFGDTLPFLSSRRILLGNLEAAATTSGSRTSKTYTFRFAPDSLRGLAEAGFSYLSIANNHSFDFGQEGFLDTLESLKRWGIATSGAGRDAADAARPFSLVSGGLDIRVLSFGAYPVDRTGFDGRRMAKAGTQSPGILWLDDDGLVAAARAFAPGTFSIALVHGGQEWLTLPTEDQKRLYRALVDAGADMVIGSHPHVLQGMEARRGGLIAYSLGNFLFPGMEGTPGGQDSVILRVGVSGGAIRCVQVVPVRLHQGTVRLAPTDAAARTVASLSAILSRSP